MTILLILCFSIQASSAHEVLCSSKDFDQKNTLLKLEIDPADFNIGESLFLSKVYFKKSSNRLAVIAKELSSSGAYLQLFPKKKNESIFNTSYALVSMILYFDGTFFGELIDKRGDSSIYFTNDTRFGGNVIIFDCKSVEASSL